MTEITIAFGTETGNAEELATETAKRLQAASFKTNVLDLENFSLDDLSHCKTLLLITSTYGEGEPPSNAERFYDDIMSSDAPRLDQLRFSICALGDSDYELFCQCGKDFDQRFEELGATRFAPRVDCDTDYLEYDDWFSGVEQGLDPPNTSASGQSSHAQQATPQAQQAIAPPPLPKPAIPPSSIPQPAPQRAIPKSSPSLPRLARPIPPPTPKSVEPTQRADLAQLSTGQRTHEQATGTKKKPFFAEIVENYNLNHEESQKETRHLSISLKDCGTSYQVGDALGVFPRNDSELINELLYYTGLDRDERVNIDGEHFNLFYVLKYRKDIIKIDKRLLSLIPPERCPPTLLPILNDRQVAKAFIDEHHILDLAREGCLRPKATEFVEALRSLTPRLYSISSSPKAHPNHVHLTVDVLRYELHGTARRGVASNFLADAEAGSHVSVYIHHTKDFKLCAPDRPIIMIGPGTGIAPFKAMLEEREKTDAPGQSWLFFGAQRQKLDFLYQEQLEAWLKSGRLSQLDCAWSRDQAHKVYVQDLMYQNGLGIWKWLEAGAYIYVCGDAKYMAKDVNRMLLQIIGEQGRMNSDQAEAYIKRLKSEKRYLRDVY